MRRHRGRKPDLSVWREINASHDKWLVFVDWRKPEATWKTIKVVYDGRCSNKANYWSGVNVKDGRLAMSSDAQNMKEHRPELFEFVKLDVVGEVCRMSDA